MHLQLPLQALVWWGNKTADVAFAAWKAVHAAFRRKRINSIRSLLFYAHSLKRKALQSWLLLFMQRRQQRLKLQWAFANLAEHRLCVTFDAW